MKKKILVVGDSWAQSYGWNPLNPFATTTDLLNASELSKSYAVKSVAFPGCSLKQAVESVELWVGVNPPIDVIDRNDPPELVFLSAGGNDVTAKELRDGAKISNLQWMLKDGNGVNLANVKTFIDIELSGLYVRFFKAIRTLAGEDCKVVVHGYDYPYPDGRGLTPVSDWLRHHFLACNQDDDVENSKVMKYLINRLNDMLKTHVGGNGQTIGHLDLRNTVAPDLGFPEGREAWVNELHPKQAGFSGMARKLEEMVKQSLGN
jgi:lysophospholipase L1-like esterase